MIRDKSVEPNAPSGPSNQDKRSSLDELLMDYESEVPDTIEFLYSTGISGSTRGLSDWEETPHWEPLLRGRKPTWD
jgi:hypothetical protein